MTKVWDRSAAKGSSLLVLLAIADFASDDGGSAFPSIPTLARKVRMSDRQVQRIVAGLVQLGELAVVPGPSPTSSNSYQVVIGSLGLAKFAAAANLSPGDNLSPLPGDEMSPPGDVHDTPLVTPASPPGDIAVSPDPSVNRQQKPQGTEDLDPLKDFWDSVLDFLDEHRLIHALTVVQLRECVTPVRMTDRRHLTLMAPAGMVGRFNQCAPGISRAATAVRNEPTFVVFVAKATASA